MRHITKIWLELEEDDGTAFMVRANFDDLEDPTTQIWIEIKENDGTNCMVHATSAEFKALLADPDYSYVEDRAPVVFH